MASWSLGYQHNWRELMTRILTNQNSKYTFLFYGFGIQFIISKPLQKPIFNQKAWNNVDKVSCQLPTSGFEPATLWLLAQGLWSANRWMIDGWIDRQMDRWMTYKPAKGSISMEAYNLWQTDRGTNKPRGWPLQKHITHNRQTDLQASGSTPMEAHISWKLTLNSGSFLMSSLCLAANSSRFTLNVSICLAIYNIVQNIS